MSPRHDPLAKLLVDGALELHRLRLWERFDGDELLLARVPCEDAPVAVSIMGQAGQQFGVNVFRGPNAYASTARRIASDDPEAALAEASDMIGYSFDPWDAVPREYRELLLAAGLRPGTARAVPWILAKPPYEIGGPPDRDGLRTLAWVVQGLLAAHRAGELRPVQAGRGRRGRVLALDVAGDLRRPSCVARVEEAPDDAGEDERPALVALPGDLRRLKRTRQHWGLVWIPTGAAIADDPRRTSVAGLFEIGGLMIDSAMLQGAELAPVGTLLAGAFRGERHDAPPSPGLPRRITFDDGRVHAALAPALRTLGVEAVLDPDDPHLARFVAVLGQALGPLAAALEAEEDDAEGADLEPADLAAWKAADQRAAELVAGTIARDGLDTPRARKRFFAGELNEELVLERGDPGMVAGALIEWIAADYRATKRSRTLVEKLLERRDLDPGVRAMLVARRDAVLSLFRVDACDPGATIEVEDVLTGERATLHDRGLSASAREGLLLPLRLLRAGPWTFPALAGPPLALWQGDEALAQLELEPGATRRDAHLFGHLFAWSLGRGGRMPRLTNTDGDPLLPHTATFRVADGAALVRALSARADLERDDDASWTWMRHDRSPAGGPGSTVLAHLELLDDRLVLEVNSERRLASARAWIDALPGVTFERATAHALDREGAAPDDRLADPAPPDPADRELYEDLAREIGRRWLETPIPMLGDRTPRQACKTADGRAQVERLVRTMPPIGTPAGPVAPPREEMLRELGIGGR
jgi:hypothetical protein